MSISAYQTLPCRDYHIEKIVEQILKRRQLVGVPTQDAKADIKQYLYGIELIDSEYVDLPPFAHPLLVDLSTLKEYSQDKHRSTAPDYRVFVDVRNFTRITREGVLVPTSQIDYDLNVLRAALTLAVARGSLEDLNGLTHFPLSIYTRWITEQLTRRLALPPDVQMRVSIITAYYYLSQFNRDNDSDTTLFRFVTQINKATGIGADLVTKVIEGLDPIGSVEDYVKALIKHTDSIRLDQFNVVLLYGVLGGSWFGFNNRELIAVAVEHTPTFVAMVYAAVNENGYRNTIIGKLAKELNRGDIAKFFTRSVDGMVKQS